MKYVQGVKIFASILMSNKTISSYDLTFKYWTADFIFVIISVLRLARQPRSNQTVITQFSSKITQMNFYDYYVFFLGGRGRKKAVALVYSFHFKYSQGYILNNWCAAYLQPPDIHLFPSSAPPRSFSFWAIKHERISRRGNDAAPFRRRISLGSPRFPASISRFLLLPIPETDGRVS